MPEYQNMIDFQLPIWTPVGWFFLKEYNLWRYTSDINRFIWTGKKTKNYFLEYKLKNWPKFLDVL